MTTRNDTEFKPLLEREYRLFLIWRSLPLEFKNKGSAHLLKSGIDDEELLELVEIKTKLDFAEKYGLNKDTITRWTKATPPPEYRDIDWRHWAKKLTNRVIALLFEGIEAEKDANRIKLWLQSVDGFVEEYGVNSDVSTETLKGVRSIAEMLNAANPNPQPNDPTVEKTDTNDADRDKNVENEGTNVGNDTNNDS